MNFHYIQMSQYFLRQYEPFGGDINLKMDLCNYATNSYLKNSTGTDLICLNQQQNPIRQFKAAVGKLDIDKLKSIRTN